MPLLINGKFIDDAVLDGEFAQIKAYHERMRNVSCCERDPEFRATARDNIIGRVLLADEAMRSVEPSSDAELEAALEDLKQQHGGEPHFFASLGIAPDQIDLVRQDLDVSIRARKLMDRLIAADPPPAEDELRAYYGQNLRAFTRPEQRRASHISRGVPPMSDRQELVDQFSAVRAQVLDGAAEFDDLARQHSDRGADLIDLGFFGRGELPEEVEIVAFSMRVGEISPVFASTVGVHILKLTEIRPPTVTPFEEARASVVEMFLEQRRRLRAAELVERLRLTATIEELPPAPGHDDGEIAREE